MIQELTIWQSRVTGELFESEGNAINQDNVLLRKYNSILLENNYDYSIAYLQKRIIADMNDPKFENKELIKDLYEAVFGKASVRNRFYDKNPFELIWQLELLYDFNSELAEATNKTYFDYKHAALEWEKDNAGGGFDQPANWLVEKGFAWTATSITGGPAQSFLNSMDGGILASLDGVNVAGKPNVTDEFIINEEDKAKIVWDSAETAVFSFQNSKGGIVTFNLAYQALPAPK
jgi:hypothetical protein